MSRTWNQPICVPCWNARHPDRPARLPEGYGPVERCSFCGRQTQGGIYVRANPASVAYPSEAPA